MEYTEFASDLPPDRTIVFSSAEENEEAMRRLGVEQRVRQLGNGKCRIDLAVLEAGDTVLFSDRFSKAVSIYLEPPTGMVAMLFPRTANGQFLASGDNLGNDGLIVLPPGSATDIVLPDLAGSDSIVVPDARFDELAEVLCRSSRFVRPNELSLVEGNTAHLHSMRNAVVLLLAHPELDPLGEHVSNIAARTIAWIADSSVDTGRERFKSNNARSRIAKRAQAYIEENHFDAVRIEDLCKATGVGVRSLQRCFRDYFDLTITEYLKTVRLNAAHRELVAAHPERRAVTTIALRHGFTHLGRFSVEFRARFGESPRETLATRRLGSA